MLILDNQLLLFPSSTQHKSTLIHSSEKLYKETGNFHRMNTLTFQDSHLQLLILPSGYSSISLGSQHIK